jgi:AraC-like DNA-binding protein
LIIPGKVSFLSSEPFIADSFKGGTEPMLRVGPLVNIPAQLRSLGHDAESVFRDTGFRAEDFQDPDGLVPFIQASQLLAKCVTVTGCDQFGLLLGQRATLSHLGLAGFIMQAAPTVESALISLVDNLDLHDQGGSLSLERGKEYTTLCYRIDTPGVLAVEQIHDLSSVMMFQSMRLLCGPEWCPSSVHIERRVPSDASLYDRYFRSKVYYDATESELIFPSGWLGSVPPASDLLLFKHLEKEATREHGYSRQSLNDVLPGIFRRALMDEHHSAHKVASVLGIHERTLHRRLKEAGTTFRAELDVARQTFSEELLENTAMPVYDIAVAIGYADSSTFIRAFQRWTGMTPSSWRKSRLAVLKEQALA